MDYDNICISCFSEKTDTFCDKCGYKEPEKRRNSILAARLMLNGRYLIGEVVNVEKTSIEYKAFDTAEAAIVEIQEYFPRDVVVRDANGTDVSVVSQENLESYRKNISTIAENAGKMIELTDSPYIVNVFDCFECNNTVYVVKEYTEGMLLSDLVDSNGGKLDVESALEIIVPVLDGLSVIHKAGLVHRALTTKSIIITVENEVKINDFRFLKEASPYRDEDMTVHFSPGYAPPEQYRSKSRQGAFSDIYSAGAVLYRILTGKKPQDALNRMSGEEIIAPNELDDSIPENISVSIVKAMNMTSELRFKTAADFKNSLTEKNAVVDIDGELENIKAKKFRQSIYIAAAVLAAIAGFILFMVLSR